jgi:plasmid stabilization system protein ParE
MATTVKSTEKLQNSAQEKELYSVEEAFDRIDKKFIDFYGEYGRKIVNARRTEWNKDDVANLKILCFTMHKTVVKITNTALHDIENVYDYIAYELFEPITADKYIRSIYDSIKHLSVYGISLAVSERDSLLLQYGATVRNINYKKMAIIYTVENNEIIIQRIIAASLVL